MKLRGMSDGKDEKEAFGMTGFSFAHVFFRAADESDVMAGAGLLGTADEGRAFAPLRLSGGTGGCDAWQGPTEKSCNFASE